MSEPRVAHPLTTGVRLQVVSPRAVFKAQIGRLHIDCHHARHQILRGHFAVIGEHEMWALALDPGGRAAISMLDCSTSGRLGGVLP